jgi:flagellar FliJ protein
MATDLDREIAVEEQRSGKSDPSHFAYSTYARAARGRRDNLKHSADELRSQLEEAKAHHEEALAELEKAQNLDGREKGERVIEVVREKLDLGMIGLRSVGA